MGWGNGGPPHSPAVDRGGLPRQGNHTPQNKNALRLHVAPQAAVRFHDLRALCAYEYTPSLYCACAALLICDGQRPRSSACHD